MGMESYGKSAKDRVLKELQNVINCLQESVAILNSQKGIGAEFYIKTLEDKIAYYNRLKTVISRIC